MQVVIDLGGLRTALAEILEPADLEEVLGIIRSSALPEIREPTKAGEVIEVHRTGDSPAASIPDPLSPEEINKIYDPPSADEIYDPVDPL